MVEGGLVDFAVVVLVVGGDPIGVGLASSSGEGGRRRGGRRGRSDDSGGHGGRRRDFHAGGCGAGGEIDAGDGRRGGSSGFEAHGAGGYGGDRGMVGAGEVFGDLEPEDGG